MTENNTVTPCGEEVEKNLIDQISERWVIIAINNDYTPFQLVFMVLLNTVPMSQQKAFDVTFQIHEKGHAVVYSGLKSHCEKIQKELKSIYVNSIIESQSCFDV